LHTSTSRRLVSLAAAGLAAAALVPATAQAKRTHAPRTHGVACQSSKVFQGIDGDSRLYTLVSQGALEAAGGWSLVGGAALADGNESEFVHDQGDSKSLALPQGSSATTRLRCIGRAFPTFRFFARNTGDAASTLRVDAAFRRNGRVRTVTLGHVSAGAAWTASEPLVLGAGSALRSQVNGQVRLTFTPEGAGAWQIDDVYVDPYRMK
jgi:hypothetical protein